MDNGVRSERKQKKNGNGSTPHERGRSRATCNVRTLDCLDASHRSQSRSERPWSGIVLRYSIKIMEITWLECSEPRNPTYFKLCYLKEKKVPHFRRYRENVRAHPSVINFHFTYKKNICVTDRTMPNEQISTSFFPSLSPSASDCTSPNHYIASTNRKLIGSILILLRSKRFAYPCIKYWSKSLYVIARVEHQRLN